MYTIAVVGSLLGLLELMNAGYTAYMLSLASDNKLVLARPDDRAGYLFVININLLFGLYSLIGGAISFFWIRFFKNIENTKRVWFPIVYTATVPICCALGIPISLWATWLWYSRKVKGSLIEMKKQ